MYTKLERIAEIARNNPKERFTSLMHLVNKEMLIKCHYELSGNKFIPSYTDDAIQHRKIWEETEVFFKSRISR